MDAAGGGAHARPRIAFYGDDFTGATDTLATASQAGLRAILFLRVPDDDLLARAGALDVLGIAGAARSMGHAAMLAELVPVCRFFAGLGARVVHYKTCSTFDSSPSVGNIGTAIGALRPLSSGPLVAIVGGQPNLNRYCVFGNLFAAVESGGGPVFRIDRHETMSHHPVTPMTEADLRLHLARQGLRSVQSLDYTAYDLDEAALEARLEAMLSTVPDAVLFDIGHASHLAVVGRTIWKRSADGPLLAVGPSSVTQALIAHWQARERQDTLSAGRGAQSTGESSGPPGAGELPAQPDAWVLRPPAGPVLVLAGSQSGVTARQRLRAASFTQVAVDAHRLAAGGLPAVASAIERIEALLRAGRHVVAHTSVTGVEDGHAGHGFDEQNEPGEDVAPRQASQLARATGDLLRHLTERVPLRRIGIAGGDTSSYAVRALGCWGLSYLGGIGPGVAMCRLHADSAHLDGIEMMLKGGQVGQPDIFERLLGKV